MSEQNGVKRYRQQLGWNSESAFMHEVGKPENDDKWDIYCDQDVEFVRAEDYDRLASEVARLTQRTWGLDDRAPAGWYQLGTDDAWHPRFVLSNGTTPVNGFAGDFTRAFGPHPTPTQE